jgi:hypothetical protein
MPPLPENVDYASGLADNCSLSGPSGHLALLAHIARNDSIRNWQQKEPEKQLESFTRRVADTAADRARRFSLRRGMHARRYHRESLVPAFALFFAGEFGSRLVVDFLFAYAFGIAFQYFTIVPMRQLGFAEGLRASVRADTISIITFEIGMFGWMALVHFVLFASPHLQLNEAVLWFMMQVAMIVGVLTASQANA